MELPEVAKLPSLVPERVRAARLAAHFKRIQDVVVKTGLNFRTVKSYERADLLPKEPSLRVVQTLANAYGVPLDAFFDSPADGNHPGAGARSTSVLEPA